MSEELRNLTTNSVTGQTPETNVENVKLHVGRDILALIPIRHWVNDYSDEPKAPAYVVNPLFDMVFNGGETEGSAPSMLSKSDMAQPPAVKSWTSKWQQQFVQKVSAEFWADAKNSPTFDGLTRQLTTTMVNATSTSLTFRIADGIRNQITLATTTGRTIAVDPLAPTAAEIDTMLLAINSGKSFKDNCFYIHEESERHFFDLPGFEPNRDVEWAGKGLMGWYRGYRVVSCLGTKGLSSGWSVLFGDLKDVAGYWLRPMDRMHVNDQQFAATDEVALHMKARGVVYINANENQIEYSGKLNQFPAIRFFATV